MSNYKKGLKAKKNKWGHYTISTNKGEVIKNATKSQVKKYGVPIVMSGFRKMMLIIIFMLIAAVAFTMFTERSEAALYKESTYKILESRGFCIPDTVREMSRSSQIFFIKIVKGFPCNELDDLKSITYQEEVICTGVESTACAIINNRTGEVDIVIRRGSRFNAKILIHELAHVIENNHVESFPVGSNRHDFVSSYAFRVQEENFAESIVIYRFAGDYFKRMAEFSKPIEQKYAYIRDNVFNQVEYPGSNDKDGLFRYDFADEVDKY